MLSQLALPFDMNFRKTIPTLALIHKGRNFDLATALMLEKRSNPVISAYHKLRTEAIEISPTPYYHPILPLLCYSTFAAFASGVSLPRRSRYSRGTLPSLQRAEVHHNDSSRPWPSASGGSVSDEFPARLRRDSSGRTDSGAWTGLWQCKRRRPLRPYRWTQQAASRVPSDISYDLIGFVTRMDARESAQDFLSRIRGMLASNGDRASAHYLGQAWHIRAKGGRSGANSTEGFRRADMPRSRS